MRFPDRTCCRRFVHFAQIDTGCRYLLNQTTTDVSSCPSVRQGSQPGGPAPDQLQVVTDGELRPELYLMVDDADALAAELTRRDIPITSPVFDQGWAAAAVVPTAKRRCPVGLRAPAPRRPFPSGLTTGDTGWGCVVASSATPSVKQPDPNVPRTATEHA